MSVAFIMSPLGTFTPTNSGAIATVIWEYWRAAKKQGIEPVVVSRRSHVPTYPDVKTVLVDYPAVPPVPGAVQIFRLERRLNGWTHLRQRAYALRVVSALKRNHLADLPLIVNNDPELTVLLRRYFPEATIIHYFHNQQVCKPKFRREVASAVTMSFAVSDFTRQWVRDYYQLNDGCVHTVYNAVDLDRFHPAASPPPGLPVINFVGRTGIEKAPDLLLKAAKRLTKRTKDFALQLIGSNHWGAVEMDDYQRELTALTADLEQEGITVHRPGHIDRYRLPEEIRKAHIHVVPSRWDEPFGLTTVEGMASGLATVASNTGGSPEIIADAGFLFARDSEEELADHLYRLVSDASLRQDYGLRARARAQDFTWDRSWARLQSLIGF